MKHRWAALVVVLALSALMPGVASGQDTQTSPSRDRSGGLTLGQNYPNPFNPTTTIPFSVGDPPQCSDGGRLYRVSLRIYNVLAQLVAIPILQGTTGAAGEPLENMSLPCGQYTAYWDGTYLKSDREVSSGIYLSQLEVDGKSVVRKMMVVK